MAESFKFFDLVVCYERGGVFSDFVFEVDLIGSPLMVNTRRRDSGVHVEFTIENSEEDLECCIDDFWTSCCACGELWAVVFIEDDGWAHAREWSFSWTDRICL